MIFLRTTLVLLLVAVIAAPSAASAAATVRLVAERQGSANSTLVLKSPDVVHQLALSESTKGMSVVIHGKNLPATALLRVVPVRGKDRQAVWSFTPEQANFSFRAAMPTHLPKGTYIMQAVSASGVMVYAETTSFVVNGKGDINTSYKKSQTATLRIFTDEEFMQRMGIKKRPALNACRNARQEEGRDEVVCTWNESLI